MSEIRVKGFHEVSFWREDSIGLIVLKADSHGMINLKTLEELLTPLTTAVTDPEVSTIVITGQNNHFCNGVNLKEAETEPFLNSCVAISNLIHSIEKPVLSVLNGTAKDFGYELALITDIIISGNENKVGYHNDYLPVLGSSISGHQFQDLTISSVRESRNVDLIFPRENLLGDVHDFIISASLTTLSYRRNLRLSDLGRAIDFEHLKVLKHFRMTETSSKEVKINNRGE